MAVYKPPKHPSSPTGGVKPMSIEGVHIHEQDRVNWTALDRQWRIKWLKDQALAPDEPRRVPELEKNLRNPIRRFFSIGPSMLYRFLEPRIGHTPALYVRYTVPKAIGLVCVSYYLYYYFKYCRGTWERDGGFHLKRSGKKDGDSLKPKQPSDYYDEGFKSRKALLNFVGN